MKAELKESDLPDDVQPDYIFYLVIGVKRFYLFRLGSARRRVQGCGASRALP
jgi:hypothetical protein